MTKLIYKIYIMVKHVFIKFASFTLHVSKHLEKDTKRCINTFFAPCCSGLTPN